MKSKKNLVVADDLTLPINIVGSKNAAIGMSGSGKSYFMTLVAEQILKSHAQMVFLDPKGEVGLGLRLLKDGKTASGFTLPIFGGRNCDAPIKPNVGAEIAELIVTQKYSAVIDLSEFEDDEIALFGRDFATRLLKLKSSHYRSSMCLMIDEAPDFVPEEASTKLIYACRAAFRRLQRQGRSHGVGIFPAAQRLQDIDKPFINLTQNWFFFQLAGSSDREAAIKQIASTDKTVAGIAREALPRLESGQAFVYSPMQLKINGKLHRFNEKETFDSSKTPEVGDTVIVPKPLTKMDLTQINATVTALIEEQKANDPKALQERIRELELEIQTAMFQEIPTVDVFRDVPSPLPVSAERLEALNRQMNEALAKFKEECGRQFYFTGTVQENERTALKAVLDEAYLKLDGLFLGRQYETTEEFRKAQEDVWSIVNEFQSVFGDLIVTDGAITEKREATMKIYKAGDSGSSPIPHAHTFTSGYQEAPPPKNWGKSDLTPVTNKPAVAAPVTTQILNALAEFASFGELEPSKAQLGFFVGKNLTAGQGASAIKTMANEGLIDCQGPGRTSAVKAGCIKLLPAGRQKAAAFTPPKTLREFHDRVRGHLKSGSIHEAIYDALIAAPIAVTRKDLGIKLAGKDGYLTAGQGASAVKDLRTAGILTMPAQGQIQASPMLFPEGLVGRG